MVLFLVGVFLIDCKTGSEQCREDQQEETSCSASDSVSEGTIENRLREEEREMGTVAVATKTVNLLERVRLATGSSSLISTNLDGAGCCRVGRRWMLTASPAKSGLVSPPFNDGPVIHDQRKLGKWELDHGAGHRWLIGDGNACPTRRGPDPFG